MHLAAFSALLNRYGPLPAHDVEAAFGACTVLPLHPAQILAEQGGADPFEYFVLEGVVREGGFTPDGEETTTSLYIGPALVLPHFCRIEHGRALLSLQALTEGWVARIPEAVFTEMRSNGALRPFAVGAIQHLLRDAMRRVVHHATLSGKDRLLKFRESHPNLENLIPHTYIAQFLGLTPVSLSRIRGQLHEEQREALRS